MPCRQVHDLGRGEKPIDVERSFRGRMFPWTGALAVLIFMISTCRAATGMTFSVHLDDIGRRIAIAKGSIEAGDSERLRTALKGADRDAFGHKTLVLDSPGGAVAEAFAMVAVMDYERVSTIVPAGATCASACAQILFLSGFYRIVADGGRLGLHSCHDARDRSRSMACNDMIARNAMAHGVPYGAILAFMHITMPGQVRWLDAREADCWGLTRWPPPSDRGVKQGDVAPCLLKGEGALKELR